MLASCVAWLCVVFDLESLIEMLNISYVLAALLEIAAFVYHRFKQPNLPRPVRIPLSNVAVTVMLIPTCVFSITVFCYSDWQSIVFTVISAAISIALSLGMERLRDAKPQWFIKVAADQSKKLSLVQIRKNSQLLMLGDINSSGGSAGGDESGGMEVVYEDDDYSDGDDDIDAPLIKSD